MIAIIGESLVDLIEQPDGRFQACLGGAPCNFTIGLARQGVKTTYLNPLSGDQFGKRFAALLESQGVVTGMRATSALPTALAVVNLDDKGTPTYAFHLQDVAYRDLTAASAIAGFPEHMALLHTGGLALLPADRPIMQAVMQEVRQRGALLSIDANLRPMATRQLSDYLDAVMHALTLAHIVKASDEDIAALGFADADAFAQGLFASPSVQLIAVTRGQRGASLLTRECKVERAAPLHLRVVDTVGAGDCFHAGLIAWLQRRGKLVSVSALATLDQTVLEAALEHAICAASVNVTRAGCDPATWEETNALKSG